MDETIKKVAAFHDAFGQSNATEITMPYNTAEGAEDLLVVASQMRRTADLLMLLAEKHLNPAFLRLQLCQEELGELADALLDEDAVAALDALCDMRYVADGTALTLGLQHVFNQAFDEVHRSNMTKLDADGNPVINAAGRVVKGPLFEQPDLGQFVLGSDHVQMGHVVDEMGYNQGPCEWLHGPQVGTNPNPKCVPHRAWMRPLVLAVILAGCTLLGVSALGLWP